MTDNNEAQARAQPSSRRRWKRAALLLFLGGCAVGFVLVWILLYLLPKPSFRVVCIPPLGHDKHHRAISGKEVLLKAVVRAPYCTHFEYEWDFGDGSKPVSGVVTDPHNLGVRHSYPAARAGTVYRARLRVRDTRTKTEHRDAYRIKLYDPSDETLSAIARENALWFLHTTIQRAVRPGEVPRGTWGASYRPAVTAFGALAFLLNGYSSTGDADREPYSATVHQAMTFVLSQLGFVPIQKQSAGDPDGNGNGQGLLVPGTDRSLYETPIVALAVIADGLPDRKINVGSKAVDGRTYREVVQDLMDFLAFAQCENGDARGGWRYVPNDGAADMSVTQWPVMAMLSAEKTRGIAPPLWVRKELRDNFLQKMYAENRGFRYVNNENRVTTSSAASGLICLHFCGLTMKDAHVQQTVNALGASWGNDNVGNFYTMYSIMKAALLTIPTVEEFGPHNWRSEYNQNLFKSQQAAGNWPTGPRADHLALATAWGVLILTPRLFVHHRAGFWLVSLLLCLLILLVVAGWWFCRRTRRRRKPPELEVFEPQDSG